MYDKLIVKAWDMICFSSNTHTLQLEEEVLVAKRLILHKHESKDVGCAHRGWSTKYVYIVMYDTIFLFKCKY